MKKVIIVSSLMCSASFAAQPVYHSIGASSTLGSVTNIRALYTSLSNPASGYLMVNSADGDKFRMGLLGSVGVGFEMGEVDSLAEELEELEELLEDGANSVAEANEAEEKFDAFLEQAGEDGYIKASVVGSVPFFPLIYKSRRYGAFTLDLTFGGLGKLSVLDDPDGVTISGTDLETDSAVYTQTMLSTTLGLGYSNRVWRTGMGDLIVGAKLNATEMELTRTVANIEYTDSSEDEGKASTSNVSADVGLLLAGSNLVIGLMASNINEPEYDLGELGDCTGLSSVALTNCTASQTFASEVGLTGVYTAEMQTTVEAALSLAGKSLSLQASYDLNSVEDATGDEYQWSVVSLSYYGDSHFLPGLRVGLRQNMAGTELSYANAGLTLLKRLNLDVGVALETVEIDGTELPRAAYANLGFTSAF